MRLTPEVEADHINWIVRILGLALERNAPGDELLIRSRITSALQHAEILKRSMAEREAA